MHIREMPVSDDCSGVALGPHSQAVRVEISRVEAFPR